MILIHIFSIWNIGRFLKENEQTCLNIHQLCSNYLSYYYGNSIFFSLIQIQRMKKLYTLFPIYMESMNKIKWNSYIELLNLSSKECYFYYAILLFCGDDYEELKNMIHSNIYIRI